MEEPERGRLRKRLGKLYTRHRTWLVPAVILVVGVVIIWVAMKVYIGE
jgi:hypothetical protein